MSCDNVPTTSEIAQAKKDVNDFNTFMTSTSDTFVDSKSVSRLTLQGAINKFGFGIADFTFTEGGTLSNRKLLVSNDPIDGFLYRYVGAGTFPITVTASTDPTTGTDWEAFTATSAEFVSNANGGSVQDFIDTVTFKTVADMKAFTNHIVGSKVIWQGYYSQSDGGSNWGIVKSGAHVDDCGSIFSIDTNTYVAANMKGNRVSVAKFGAKNGVTSFNSRPMIQTCLSATKKAYLKGNYYGSGPILMYTGYSMYGDNIVDSSYTNITITTSGLPPIETGGNSVVYDVTADMILVQDGTTYVENVTIKDLALGSRTLAHAAIKHNIFAPFANSCNFNNVRLYAAQEQFVSYVLWNTSLKKVTCFGNWDGVDINTTTTRIGISIGDRVFSEFAGAGFTSLDLVGCGVAGAKNGYYFYRGFYSSASACWGDHINGDIDGDDAYITVEDVHGMSFSGCGAEFLSCKVIRAISPSDSCEVSFKGFTSILPEPVANGGKAFIEVDGNCTVDIESSYIVASLGKIRTVNGAKLSIKGGLFPEGGSTLDSTAPIDFGGLYKYQNTTVGDRAGLVEPPVSVFFAAGGIARYVMNASLYFSTSLTSTVAGSSYQLKLHGNSNKFPEIAGCTVRTPGDYQQLSAYFIGRVPLNQHVRGELNLTNIGTGTGLGNQTFSVEI